MITYLFSFVFPFMLILLVLQITLGRFLRKLNTRNQNILTTILAALICVLPVEGVSFARLIYGVNANFSIPLTILLFDKLWRRMSGSQYEILDERTIKTMRRFVIVMSLILYPASLGLGPYDPYTLGQAPSILFLALFILTIWLLLKRNRFGVVLIIGRIAFAISVLESPNAWDYLIDPFLTIWAFAQPVKKLWGVALLKLKFTKKNVELEQVTNSEQPIKNES